MTGYNRIFNVINEKKNNFYFAKSITVKDGFVHITIQPGAYEIESLNNEIERNIFAGVHFTESNHPFTIKPNFSTPGFWVEISRQEPFVSFLLDDSIKNFLGLNAVTLYEKCNLSPNRVAIFSFDNIFVETDRAQGMTSERRSEIIHNFTVDFDPGN